MKAYSVYEWKNKCDLEVWGIVFKFAPRYLPRFVRLLISTNLKLHFKISWDRFDYRWRRFVDPNETPFKLTREEFVQLIKKFDFNDKEPLEYLTAGLFEYIKPSFKELKNVRIFPQSMRPMKTERIPIYCPHCKSEGIVQISFKRSDLKVIKA